MYCMTRQSLRCSNTQSTNADEDSGNEYTSKDILERRLLRICDKFLILTCLSLVFVLGAIKKKMNYM